MKHLRLYWITAICLALVAPAFAGERKAGAMVTTIDSAAFNQDADGARIVLNADGPLLYTSYEPKPDLLVVDLSGASLAASFAAPPVSGALVSDLRVEPIDELGHLQTRLSIRHAAGLKYEISSQGRALAIAFEGEAVSEPPAAAATAPEPPGPAVVTAAEEAPRPAAPESSRAAEPQNVPTGEIARNLERIEVSGHGSNVSVAVIGDGVLRGNEFELQNPARLVVDFPGLKNAIRPHTLKGSGPVRRIRVSQFRTAPDPVVRVVLDLEGSRGYQVERVGERFVVHFPGAEAAATSAPVSRTEVASAPPVEAPAPVAPVAPLAAAAPAADSTPEPKPAPIADTTPAPSPTAVADAATISNAGTVAAASPVATPTVSEAVTETPVKTAPEEPVAAPPTPPAAELPKTEAAPKTETHTAVAPSHASSAPKTGLAKVVTGPGVDSIPAEKRAPGVLDAHRVPPHAKTVKEVQPQSTEDVLFESAEAMLADQKTPADRQELASSYNARTMGGGEAQYTGEPVSLDLKDADIKDVFRTISELTGLNIVIDPDVRGIVTVRLENVPWDQALELILKQNGLGYILENNVMRIATSGKLQVEESQRAALDAARQQSVPTKTIIKKLSYADAGTTAETIKKIMSPRGDIIIDERTNTLIIREIQDYIPTVIQLIESLDTATQQVEIESRIIETTKKFGRNLGINWGFNGVSDAAHGNTTNLQFPNNGSVSGTVGLAAPALNTLKLSLGNVLDTFNLNVALQAAENQGLVRIISSPKISALTNEKAFIQSGLQVPVQTVVNNTTSTVYIDATLRLEVTPKITAEGTVLLDLHVQKKDAQFGINPQGGANVPISVREAKTRVIVKDGGTAVIGGIFTSDDEDQYNQVPGLWKIPIFGALFRNSIRSDTHEELLIFITPRIVH